MEFLLTVASCTLALVIVKVSQWWYRWSNPKCNGKLPPGSMGFPIIGETFDFFKPHGLYEISPFVKKRMSRYGPLFRTNVLGSRTVVSTDMDVNIEILRQENKSFVAGLPDSFVKMMGKDNLFANHGKIHKHIKQIILRFFGSENLKQNMIKDIDRVTREHLRAKAIQGSFDVKDAVSSLLIAHLTPKMISNLQPETQRKLMDGIKVFNTDWFQPNLTLSTWRSLLKALTGRRNALRVIKDAHKRRKESNEKYGDFLDTILEDLEKDGSLLSQDTSESLMFFVAFASRETTSHSISLAVKFLSENPKVLAELKVIS